MLESFNISPGGGGGRIVAVGGSVMHKHKSRGMLLKWRCSHLEVNFKISPTKADDERHGFSYMQNFCLSTTILLKLQSPRALHLWTAIFSPKVLAPLRQVCARLKISRQYAPVWTKKRRYGENPLLPFILKTVTEGSNLSKNRGSGTQEIVGQMTLVSINRRNITRK